MSNYKYSLTAKFTSDITRDRFEKSLRELDYKKSSHYGNGEFGISNSPEGNCKNGEYSIWKTASIADYNFNINNKWEYEAALAIAAIRDDNKPYVGEWTIVIDKYKRDFSKEKWVAKIVKVNLNTNHFNTTFCPNATVFWESSFDTRRKATPEEIIAYMKEKYMFYGSIPTLPEKWCISTEETKDKKDFQKWYEAQFGWEMGWTYTNHYLHYPGTQNNGKNGINYPNIKTGYIEITYEQWKEWYNYQQQLTKNQQVMELPKNWCIQGGEELAEFIKEQEIKLGVSIRISGEHDDQYYWLNNPENFTSWGCCISIPSNRELVSFKQFKEWYNQQTMNKNKDKKIIGYKLIKEYPGAFVKLHETVITNGTKIGEQIQKGRNETRDIIYSDYPEFWEPIYEPEKRDIIIKIECSSPFTITVRKGSSHIETNEGSVRIERLKQLQSVSNSPTNKIESWDFKINTVDIGCKKNIPFRYLDEIIKAWEELNT